MQFFELRISDKKTKNVFCIFIKKHISCKNLLNNVKKYVFLFYFVAIFLLLLILENYHNFEF